MKKLALAAVAISASSFLSDAQSAVDAYTLSQNEMRGTARFMSMAGAFTALGGDLSTLNQNPGGIGIFRRHEVGITADLNFSRSSSPDMSDWNMTKFHCNNFGYVGAVDLDNDVMPYLQFGATYSRSMSFDRQYRGSWNDLGNSMSNYVANFTNASHKGQGVMPDALGQSTTYNPYNQSGEDWLSILSYNSYLINSPSGRGNDYQGLYKEGTTTGDSFYDVIERGYVDEYNISFGGNLAETVYWGMGFGITDLQFTRESNYDEQLTNAMIPAGEYASHTVNGNAYFNLNNYSHTSGTGFNYKIGLIFKPIQELRIGMALHTPTYYNFTTNYDARIDYSYSSFQHDGIADSDFANYNWKLRTPLKFMVGAAGVIGGAAIISVDYEYQGVQGMKVSSGNGIEYDDLTDDIKYYYKATNTVRLGLEYRLSKNFSARAGFARTSSGVNQSTLDGEEYVITSGTNPAYTFDRSIRYITCGLGYRSGGFSVDMAYVNKFTKSTYQPYSSYESDGDWWYAPYCDFTTSNNHIVLTMGYKF